MKHFDRSQRVADEILRHVSELIRTEVKDFDLTPVTLIHCEVTRDLSEARLRYSVLGDDETRRRCADAMSKLSGFLQHRVGQRLGLRLVPKLRFAYDESVAEAGKLQELFEKIARERDTDAQS
ncbi:MAG: 30S ribosome-binding factor RbfA [candidate division Zixibacteria bacterium]|nr:30S ribosome-binding factor RbfA [candidate division Zixibacteria bacterium]